METTVIKGLFKEKVYNGDESIPGYMQDYYSNVFGGARLRQIRIQSGKAGLFHIMNKCGFEKKSLTYFQDQTQKLYRIMVWLTI